MDRYDELLDTIYEITFGKIESRIIKKLAEIEVKNNSKDIEITHQALANMLGTTRVVVSRILKKLENEGLIHLNRGTINRI